MRILALIITSLIIVGCHDDYQRHLSQFGIVDSEMKKIELKLSSGIVPIYCGNSDSEAALSYKNSELIFSKPPLKNEINGVSELSKGIYLYYNLSNEVHAIASIPHNRFPVNEVYLIIKGKVVNGNNTLYIQSGIGIDEFDEFAELLQKGVVEHKCFE